MTLRRTMTMGGVEGHKQEKPLEYLKAPDITFEGLRRGTEHPHQNSHIVRQIVS
jgi:hypothetical protein